MIASLQGKVILKGKDFIILEVNGIGYKVFLSEKVLNRISEKQSSFKIFTSLYLREGVAELYGFLSFEELELFETLNDISGVGPKTALSLTSFGSLEKLKTAIEKGKEKFYQEVKGIGKKKIQKILLELTGMIKSLKEPVSKEDEAFQALVKLGFPLAKVKQTLQKLPKGIKGTEERIKEALKILGK